MIDKLEVGQFYEINTHNGYVLFPDTYISSSKEELSDWAQHCIFKCVEIDKEYKQYKLLTIMSDTSVNPSSGKVDYVVGHIYEVSYRSYVAANLKKIEFNEEKETNKEI